MPRWLLVLLLVSSSLLVVPSGSAQLDPFYRFSTEVWLAADPDPVVPVRETGHVPFKVEVRCGPFGLAPLEPVPMTLHVEADKPWAVPNVSPQTVMVRFPPDGCLNGYSDVINGLVEFSFSQDAPAFERVEFSLRAAMPHADVVTERWNQMAGMYFQTSARTDPGIIHAAANQHVQVPILIENHGNGPIQVRFQVADGTSQELQLALPAPVIVPPFGGGVTVDVDVNTPYGFDGTRSDALIIGLLPASAYDVGLHDAALQVSGMIVTRGDGGSGGLPAEELPAPGLVAPWVGLALIGAALRRRA